MVDDFFHLIRACSELNVSWPNKMRGNERVKHGRPNAALLSVCCRVGGQWSAGLRVRVGLSGTAARAVKGRPAGVGFERVDVMKEKMEQQ